MTNRCCQWKSMVTGGYRPDGHPVAHLPDGHPEKKVFLRKHLVTEKTNRCCQWKSMVAGGYHPDGHPERSAAESKDLLLL
ncbi:hypothetical protein [Ravibacter arvi]|uniref:hypothetical protein n=1 Tax=Ravibacter arvi TaxID=2051041 RepID=UPI0031EAE002